MHLKRLEHFDFNHEVYVNTQLNMKIEMVNCLQMVSIAPKT